MCSYPDFIIAIAYVKLAAIEANHTLGVINDVFPTTQPLKIKLLRQFSTVINNNLDNFMKPEVEKCGKVWRTKKTLTFKVSVFKVAGGGHDPSTSGL